MKKLKVKYKSQWSEDASRARGDCMEAAYAMVYEYVTDDPISTDKVVKAAGPNLAGTNVKEIVDASGDLGLPLVRLQGNGVQDLKPLIDKNKPPIVIIDYSKIPQRQDKNYEAGHAVVVIGHNSGGVYVNDPDHWGRRRKTEYWRLPEFHNAWLTTSERNIVQDGTMLVPKWGRDMVDYRKQLEKCKKEKKKYKKWADELGKKKDDWKKWCQEKGKKITKLEKKIKQKNLKLKSLRKQRLGFKKSKKKFQRKFLDKSEKVDELTTQIDELATERGELRAKISEITEDTNRRVKLLKDALRTLRHQKKDLERELGMGGGEMSKFYEKWQGASGWQWILQGVKKLRG